MKKTLLVVAAAALLTFAFAGTAFADHSPSFFLNWDAAAGGNAGTGSPHSGYSESTMKCEVCHAVHRAPVPGSAWNDPAGPTPVKDGEFTRTDYKADNITDNPSFTGNTQLLLMSSASGSCNYCHINTSIGGAQLYGGQPLNQADAAASTNKWDEGYAHHNGCTGCHAVHGAFAMNNVVSAGVNPAAAGLTAGTDAMRGTFQGALKPAILKVGAKGNSTGWMEEVYVAGSAGYTATYVGGATPVVDNAQVDPKNVPLFASRQDAVMGTGNRTDAPDVYEDQVSVFCTFCHQNYGSASEATVNPNGSISLFQAQWTASDGTSARSGVKGVVNSGTGMEFKNHPMKVAGTNLLADRGAATGASVKAGTVVAFANANTCRDCHDAGVARGTTGIIYQSFPHFTPGYWKFIKAGGSAGNLQADSGVTSGATTVGDVAADLTQQAAFQAVLADPAAYDAAPGPSDGLCLKCHVNNAGTAGVGINF